MSEVCQECGGKYRPTSLDLRGLCTDCWIEKHKRGSELWDETVRVGKIEDAVFKTATTWWRNLKPLHWSEDEHLQNPWVNTKGKIEHELAVAVAEMVKENKNKW